jgi:hypothetical protein
MEDILVYNAHNQLVQLDRTASQLKDIVHILITEDAQGRQNIQVKYTAHKFHQATEFWCLEVVEFPIEIGSFAACRFPFLIAGIFV